MSSQELMTESVELSEAMLGIIGAYGMRSALEVRDLDPRAESTPPEHRPHDQAQAGLGTRPKL